MSGFLAQLAGHEIAVARRFEHEREERRDLPRSGRPQDHLGHISKPEGAAYFSVEPRATATTIEGAQSRCDGLSPEVISRARVIEERSPAARAQGAAALVASVSDGAGPRNHDDPRRVAERSLERDGSVGGEQMDAGGDGLPEPREQPTMNRRPSDARRPHAHGVKRAGLQVRLPDGPSGSPKEFSLGGLKPNLVGI